MSLSLELPVAEVVVGAQVQGELVYGESPVEPPWLDVVLGSPVTVEVADDPAAPGLLELKVVEAPIEPALGVGVARAGLLYDGPYDLVVDPGVQLDCGSLTPDQLDFVSQSLEDLAAAQNEAFDPLRSYAHLTRAHQGSDPMRPFSAGGRLVETLTSWNGTYALQRVPDSGGLVDLDFVPAGADGTFGQDYALMEVREGPGLFEVGRRLTIDGRTWDPGFGVVVERFYADSADAAIDEASCIATFEARLEAFSL